MIPRLESNTGGTTRSSNTSRNKVTVIAEIGISHEGDVFKAGSLISAAAEAGADIVKFQSYRPAEILGPDSPHLAEATKAQFSPAALVEIRNVCNDLKVEFGLSIFHADQVPFCEDIGLKRYKVASRAALDSELLSAINKTGKPVIMSCGLLATPGALHDALELLSDCDVTPLYCVCKYPAALEDVSLYDIHQLKRLTGEFGFSSHCPMPEPTLAAVALGATVIENHIKPWSYKGCDASSSMEVGAFSRMVKMIRNMEKLAC